MGSYVKSTVVTTSNPCQRQTEQTPPPDVLLLHDDPVPDGSIHESHGRRRHRLHGGHHLSRLRLQGAKVIPGTSFGNPDYRCSTVEISTSAPWSSHSGHYYPRLVHPEMRQVAENPAVYVGGRMHHPSLRFRLHSILKNKI